MKLLKVIFFVVCIVCFSCNGNDAKPTISTRPFPADNIWNTPIDKLPVSSKSDQYIETIGKDKPLHPDFGSGLYEGAPMGIPFVNINRRQKKVNVTFSYADESDKGPYPIPADAPIEGGNNATGDRHVIAVDNEQGYLYELYKAYPQADGSWKADSGAIFNLKSNALRPETWTSADAAGLPIYPGLIRYEEVQQGFIGHAIRFTTDKTKKEYVWPARHFASSLTSDKYPPMGQRFRLKSSIDISKFSKEVQVILSAMKVYGIILADNGSPWYISGAPNDNWNNDTLRELKQIKGSDFEAVDVSSLMEAPDSGKVKETKRSK